MADSLFDKKSSAGDKSLFDAPKKPEKADIFSGQAAAKPAAAAKTAPSAATKTAKKKTSAKKVIGIVVAAVVGAGLITAGAVLAIWHNSPETIFQQALSNFVKTNDLKVDGSFTFPTRSDGKYIKNTANFGTAVVTKGDDSKMSLTFDFKYKHNKYTSSTYEYTCGTKKYDNLSDAYDDCKSGYKYKYTPGKYKEVTDTYKLSADLIVVGDDYYAKVNLDDLDVAEDLPKEVKEFSNKWYHVSKEYYDKKLKDTDKEAQKISDCVEKVTRDNRESLASDIKDIIASGGEALIKAEAGDSNSDGEIDYDITVSTSPDKYASAVKKLYALDAVKKLTACSDELKDGIDDVYDGFMKSYEDMSSSDKKSAADSLKGYLPRITLTVNKSSRQITKISVKNSSKASESDEYSVVLGFEYDTQKEEAIKAPAKYTTIDDKFLKSKGIDLDDVSLPSTSDLF